MIDSDFVLKNSQGWLHSMGDHPVESNVICVVTRFALRSPMQLLSTYLDYRRVKRQAVGSSGLLRSAFLVESPTVCYTLSIWESWGAIPEFGTRVTEHVHAGNRVLSRLAFKAGRPELWSTKWWLASVSYNLNWDGLDLRAHVRPPATPGLAD